jgi:hypothetical protein
LSANAAPRRKRQGGYILGCDNTYSFVVGRSCLPCRSLAVPVRSLGRRLVAPLGKGAAPRQAYSTSIASECWGVVHQPRERSLEPKGCAASGVCEQLPRLAMARLPFSSHAPWADTPRPATTINRPTHDVYPETVGRDETAAQPNESADAFKS